MEIHCSEISGLKADGLPPNDPVLELKGEGAAAFPDGLCFPTITEFCSFYSAVRFTGATFPNLKILRFLHLDPRRRMLSVLPELKKITSLGIGPCNETSVFGQIASPDLQRINISGGKIQSLSGISSLSELNYVRLHNLDHLTDIAELSTLKHLTALDVVWCSRLVDFDVLNDLPSLSALCIFGCKGFKKEKYQAVLDALPQANVLV